MPPENPKFQCVCMLLREKGCVSAPVLGRWLATLLSGNICKEVKDPNFVGSLRGHKEGSKAFARYPEIGEDLKKELVR